MSGIHGALPSSSALASFVVAGFRRHAAQQHISRTLLPTNLCSRASTSGPALVSVLIFAASDVGLPTYAKAYAGEAVDVLTVMLFDRSKRS